MGKITVMRNREEYNIRIPDDLNDKAILRRNHCKTGTDT